LIIEHRLALPKAIVVAFEDNDFKRRTAEGALAWLEAKEELKRRLPHPRAIFSDDLQAWLVEDSPAALKILNEIKEKYFVDKNQLKLI
jgi:hypothetical protein